MNSKHSDYFAISVVSVFFLCTLAAMTLASCNVEPQQPSGFLSTNSSAKVTSTLKRVIDGDTFVCDVSMYADEGDTFAWDVAANRRPLRITLLDQHVRVYGVDAAERGTPKGDKAKLEVKNLMADKQIVLTPKGKDNFGRLLAIVTLIDSNGNETVLADWLIQKDYGIFYKGSK